MNAPMIQVNNEWFYEDLTPDSMVAILDKWKAGETPKIGPQIDRQHSCGFVSRTSLEVGFEQETHTRDFGAEKQTYDDAKAKAAAAAAAAKK